MDTTHLELWKSNLVSPIRYVIQREEILDGSIETVSRAVLRAQSWLQGSSIDLESLKADPAVRAIELRSPTDPRSWMLVHLYTNAFDSDPRPLSRIPEMQRWSRNVSRSFPGLFSLLDIPTLDWFFACTFEIGYRSAAEGRTTYDCDAHAVKQALTDIDRGNEAFALTVWPEDRGWLRWFSRSGQKRATHCREAADRLAALLRIRLPDPRPLDQRNPTLTVADDRVPV